MLCLFLNVQWVGLLCVIVVFLGHTHLVFNSQRGTLCFIVLILDLCTLTYFVYQCVANLKCDSGDNAIAWKVKYL